MIAIRRILALSILPAILGAAPPSTKFHREILRRGQGTEVVIVPIDEPVYEATRDGFPDVRVVDDRGEEAPYVLGPVYRQKTATVQEVVPSRVVSLNAVEGGPLEVTVELDDGTPEPDAATVQTPLVDFERWVRVQGSRDGESWTLLAEGRIFDYSRYINVRGVEIRFPARGFRRFRLVFDREADQQRSPFAQLSRTRGEQGGDTKTEFEAIVRRPFRIDRIEFHRTVERPQGGVEEHALKAPLTILDVETDRTSRQTRIEVDGLRLPLAHLKLLTRSRNFRRPAWIAAKTEGGWREVGRGDLLLYQLGDFYRQETTLEVWRSQSTGRFGRLRIVIDNGEDDPLDVAGVEGFYSEYRLQFIAEPGRSYRLFYGSESMAPPRDVQEIMTAALIKHREREVALLGEPVHNPAYVLEVAQASKALPAWLLPLTLVLMTIVLAWAVVMAVRRAEKMPLDDFEG